MKKTEFNPLGFLGFFGFLGFLGVAHEGLYFLHILFFLLFLGFIPRKDKKEEGGADDKKEKDSPGALFIPAGVLTGMGVGFFVGNIPGAMFTGLGLGFVFFALYEIFINKKGDQGR